MSIFRDHKTIMTYEKKENKVVFSRGEDVSLNSVNDIKNVLYLRKNNDRTES